MRSLGYFMYNRAINRTSNLEVMYAIYATCTLRYWIRFDSICNMCNTTYMDKRVVVYLPEDLHRELKSILAREGVSLSKWMRTTGERMLKDPRVGSVTKKVVKEGLRVEKDNEVLVGSETKYEGAPDPMPDNIDSYLKSEVHKKKCLFPKPFGGDIYYLCENNATVEKNGKWFCEVHGNTT